MAGFFKFLLGRLVHLKHTDHHLRAVIIRGRHWCSLFHLLRLSQSVTLLFQFGDFFGRDDFAVLCDSFIVGDGSHSVGNFLFADTFGGAHVHIPHL